MVPVLTTEDESLLERLTGHGFDTELQPRVRVIGQRAHAEFVREVRAGGHACRRHPADIGNDRGRLGARHITCERAGEGCRRSGAACGAAAETASSHAAKRETRAGLRTAQPGAIIEDVIAPFGTLPATIA
jgi:hypothetical protein